MVTIAGDEVVESGRFVHIPEDWERDYRNRRGVTQVIQIACVVLVVRSCRGTKASSCSPVEIAPARVYKRETPRTAPDDHIRALATEITADDPIERLHKLMDGLRHMLIAHRRAYDLIKEQHPEAQIGIAHNMIAFRRARKGNLLDDDMKRRLHLFYNLLIPKAFVTNRLRFRFPLLVKIDEPVQLDNRIDFWGVNYYYRMHVRFRLRPSRPFDMLFVPRSKHGLSDMGWEIYPRGLYKCCRWLRFTKRPLIITENGIAADDDTVRVRFLERHLKFLDRLRAEGMDIRGYYYWSMLDNYEWLVGETVRFGLFHVDYDNNLERTIKPSGKYFAKRIISSV